MSPALMRFVCNAVARAMMLYEFAIKALAGRSDTTAMATTTSGVFIGCLELVEEDDVRAVMRAALSRGVTRPGVILQDAQKESE